MESKPVLLTGISGQVGFELHSLLSGSQAVALSRTDFDLSRPETLTAMLDAHQPRIIINPAAYTAVDKAESEPELARLVNVDSVEVMASWAQRHQALMIHYSTDYVFDGTRDRPYLETDSTHPLSVYGRTKCQGEVAIRQSGCRHIILRTSWVAGIHGNNFIKTILRLAQSRDSLKVVADQEGAPTSAALIAKVTMDLLALDHANPLDSETYHLSASGWTTWYDYACHIVRRAWDAGMELKLRPESIAAIASEAYPVPAPRPRNSRLNGERLQRRLGLACMPTWQEGVDAIIDNILSQSSHGADT
ncbi:MAG: dTDP-4-dehydrorhamnose reductase [Pseudomonadales bacterium]|nr:dTDP-4-dehydrorhamnose reductase [Pseudomonadales bacterium]